jgi:hypothetical protein
VHLEASHLLMIADALLGFAATGRVQEPVNDDCRYLSALVAINQGRIKPFHEKHRIDALVGRIAI